jgi:hypothetical protein
MTNKLPDTGSCTNCVVFSSVGEEAPPG